jgi:hypothetical protein
MNDGKPAAVTYMEDVHCNLVEEIVNHEETIMVVDEEDDWTTKGESSDEEE